MAADVAGAAREFADLAKNLRLVGEEDLRRELLQAVDDAAQPLADEIGNVTHLRADMPNRYADVLAKDLRISAHKTTGGPDPGVTLLVRAPTRGRGGRKVRQRNAGIITHPFFGDRDRWYVQTAGMRPGFVDTPVERAAPHVRDKILEAVHRITEKAVGRYERVAKIRIDGEYFEYDRDHKPMAEMLALEKALGTTYGEWEEGLAKGSAKALAGLIWLVWKRNGREKPLEDILASDINLGALVIEGDEPPDPTTSPAGKEASTTTAASTSARSAKSG